MRRGCLAIIAACLPLLLCMPALAQHTGPYIGGYVGGNLLTTAESSDNKGNFNLSYKPAIQGSAVIGWDVGPDNPIGGEGRIELEYTRRSNKLDKAEFAQGKARGGGDLTVDSLLLNSFYVYRDNRIWSPYIGIGVGAARMSADLQVSGARLGNGSANVFAYQLGTGVDVDLFSTASLDIGYRFFGSTRPKFSEPDGTRFSSDYFNHSVVLGVRWGF